MVHKINVLSPGVGSGSSPEGLSQLNKIKYICITSIELKIN